MNIKFTESGIEVAFRHFGHVKLMQEFTLVPLLAEPPEPVLADNCPVCTKVPVGADSIPLALPLGEECANHGC